MSLIGEFRIETPILQEALDAVPEMVLHTEEIHLRPGQSSKSIISAWGDDFQIFEQNLETDPTVDEYECLTDLEERRLYRLRYSEEGEEFSTYPLFAEHDIVMLDTTGTKEGLDIRARFPTREALRAYREACEERDVPFHLRSLYLEEEIVNDGGMNDRYGVTAAQRVALRYALEMGYFAIPRQTTLKEIADELEISTQSVSQRLRRGQANLLRTVLDQ